jgi:hypothetical protein
MKEEKKEGTMFSIPFFFFYVFSLPWVPNLYKETAKEEKPRKRRRQNAFLKAFILRKGKFRMQFRSIFYQAITRTIILFSE